ncbi:MAG: hypothetical protein MJZ16_09910 [Bacteroidales bacterium]|nr:hypothetical protein [Bacteroidales bacterium]
MRRILLAIILASVSFNSFAQGQIREVFERTYISTDKAVYVSGDRIWCSAFCIDTKSDKLSQFSSTAYLELVSDGNIVQTAKVALEAGRGNGYIDIPESTPTGNYRLVAYTAVNKNEEGLDILDGSKVVSILNPYNTTRLKGKVDIASEENYKALESSSPENAGKLKASYSAVASQSNSTTIKLSNEESSPVSVSVSVYHNDGIVSPANKSMAEMNYSSVVPGKYVQNVVPDFEGEVIYATLVGKDAQKIIADKDATAYISSPGCMEDTYVTTISSDGKLAFKTYNIFGDKDLVCEIADMNDESLVGSISLDSPFINFANVDVPNLVISEHIAPAVIARGASMQLFNRQYADSLRQFVGRKENMPYLINDAKVYELDDYTRFPSVKEVLVEILQEARVRGHGDKTRIQVMATNGSDDNAGNWKTSLVLIDGVPVFKHKDMMDYDAMLLKAVEIWPSSYFFASKTYDGVINFVSKSGNMAYMDFASNVKIVDFKGACYPMEYTERHNPNNEQDMRQTILWKPEVEIAPGEEMSLECLLPSYSGKFDVVVEGITSEGKPLYYKSTFNK